jgi:6,7-dimethyl-8-ribityllumazine synthase
MSGHGSPTLNLEGAENLQVTVVAGQWHEQIATGLLEGAIRVLQRSGCRYSVIHVPGSFELPVVAKAALEAGSDAVVALGVIIRGGTPHFEYVSQAATTGLTEVALATGKPVGFGVLTLDDEAQGIDRAGFPDSSEDKGAEAAEAALATALTLTALRG